MKRLLALLLAGLLLLGAAAVPAFAAETEPAENLAPADAPADSCGPMLTWSYGDGTLTVSGSGTMYDYPQGAPWLQYAGTLRTLRLEGSVTSVGAQAFRDYDALETVDFGSSLTEIGTAAFSSCDSLTSVTLPGTFRIFGEESFSHCKNLKEFRFGGGMPKFKYNCLWDTSAKLIYPANNPWPLVHVQQLEEAFQGRIEFLSSDGTDPIPGEEPETPVETLPETTAATVPETTAETTAETAVETTAATEAPAVTETPTQPAETPTEKPAETRPQVPELPQEPPVELPEPEEDSGIGAFGVSMLILVMVLCLGGILAAAVFLIRSRAGAEPEKPRKEGTAPAWKPGPAGKPGTGKPTQAQKAAKKKPRSRGGKYSR